MQKISVAEQRTIAESFLPNIPDVARQPFEGALAERSFWSKWTMAFRSVADQSIFINWMKWRHDRIMSLFEERLRADNISDAAISTAVAEIKNSKQAKSAPGNTSTQSVPGPSGRAPDMPLRALAHSALDLMSEAEIRSIWLPFGVVADACRRTR